MVTAAVVVVMVADEDMFVVRLATQNEDDERPMWPERPGVMVVYNSLSFR